MSGKSRLGAAAAGAPVAAALDMAVGNPRPQGTHTRRNLRDWRGPADQLSGPRCPCRRPSCSPWPYPSPSGLPRGAGHTPRTSYPALLIFGSPFISFPNRLRHSSVRPCRDRLPRSAAQATGREAVLSQVGFRDVHHPSRQELLQHLVFFSVRYSAIRSPTCTLLGPSTSSPSPGECQGTPLTT